MIKLYNVKVCSVADNPEQALQVARSNAPEIMLDVSAEVIGEVKSKADLIDGWEPRAVPYGADESIATILKEQPR